VYFSPQIEGELRELRSHKSPSHRFDARGAPRQQHNERDRYQSNSSSRPKYDHHRNQDVRELISAKTGGGSNSKRKISDEEDRKEEQLQDKHSSMNNTSTAEKDDDDGETEEREHSNNKRYRNDKSAAADNSDDDDDDRVRGGDKPSVDDTTSMQAANTTDIAEKAEDQKPPVRQPLQATKQRDRRMFGALMGHLGAARQDFKKNAVLLETRQKVEEVCVLCEMKQSLIVKKYMVL